MPPRGSESPHNGWLQNRVASLGAIRMESMELMDQWIKTIQLFEMILLSIQTYLGGVLIALRARGSVANAPPSGEVVNFRCF